MFKQLRPAYPARLVDAAHDVTRAPAPPLAAGLARLWNADMGARTWLCRMALLPPSTLLRGDFDALTGSDRAALLAAAAALLSVAQRLSGEIAESPL